ncbi:hypothetical protein D3C78_1573950 [compost metagenome]
MGLPVIDHLHDFGCRDRASGTIEQAGAVLLVSRGNGEVYKIALQRRGRQAAVIEDATDKAGFCQRGADILLSQDDQRGFAVGRLT